MPTIYDAVGEFQERLLRNERRAAAQMVRVYADSWKRIKARLAVLQKEYERAQAQGQDVGLAWLYQKQRLTATQALVAKELAHFSAFSQRTISSQQARAIAESLTFNRDMTILAMGAEYDEQSRFAVRSLNTGAIAALVGATQAGSALDTLFRGIRAEGAQAAEDALVQGIVLGYNPRKIAPMIRDALGVQLNRALTISRTETMRAQRVAASESYKANADVMKGWRWQAALTGNTCPVCISMHGSIHPVEEEMESHPNCRCVMIPVTKSWEELGAELGVDFSGVEKAGPSFEEIAKKYKLSAEQKRTYAQRKMTGEAYFRGLSAEEQRKILGPAKWLAWKEGKFEFTQLAKKTYSPVWGAGRGAKSLKELLGEQDADYYLRLTQKRTGKAEPEI
jgi:SPP1 gp7 family putative phage head morphogenesis protein